MEEEPQEHRASPRTPLPLPFSRKDLAQLSAALLACKETSMTREISVTRETRITSEPTDGPATTKPTPTTQPIPTRITFTATTIPVSHPWPTIMAVQLRVSMPRMEWVQTFESTGEMVRFVWGEGNGVTRWGIPHGGP